ncbi:hypothetical protein BDD12DRAFT_332356 [Trichophaea hybrida]|nr:hypothetical protein BDD12DRAFT_332356 [Trichophaea hybrida]
MRCDHCVVCRIFQNKILWTSSIPGGYERKQGRLGLDDRKCTNKCTHVSTSRLHGKHLSAEVREDTHRRDFTCTFTLCISLSIWWKWVTVDGPIFPTRSLAHSFVRSCIHVVSGCIGEMCKVEGAIYISEGSFCPGRGIYYFCFIFSTLTVVIIHFFFTWILLALHAYFLLSYLHPSKYLLSTHNRPLTWLPLRSRLVGTSAFAHAA